MASSAAASPSPVVESRKVAAALLASARLIGPDERLSDLRHHVLGIIIDQPGLASIQLAAQLRSTASTISRLTDALVEAGLITKTRTPSTSTNRRAGRHQREVRLEATRAGRAVHRARIQDTARRLRPALDRLAPDARAALQAHLEHLRDALAEQPTRATSAGAAHDGEKL